MNLILLGTKGGLSLLQGHGVKFVHVGRREGHNLDQNCERCQAQLVLVKLNEVFLNAPIPVSFFLFFSSF